MYIWKRLMPFQGKTRSPFSLFAKINLLIVVLFIPILIMYTYSNNVTYDVVSKELQISNTKQAHVSVQSDRLPYQSDDGFQPDSLPRPQCQSIQRP